MQLLIKHMIQISEMIEFVIYIHYFIQILLDYTKNFINIIY